MKKSPLSTPNRNGNNFHRGSNRRGGHGHNQPRKNNDNYQQFPESNNSTSYQANGDMIPLYTSTPKFQQNRGNWRRQTDMRNQRFSNTGISDSYNDQQNNFHSSPESPYSPHKYQRNHQHPYREKKELNWHRKLPISEFIDIRTIFNNPWAELEKELANFKSQKDMTSGNDSSIQIILEKSGLQNSSEESNSDETTINISSSCDEIKEGSSVDLQLESMNFSRNSKNANKLSNSVQSDSVSSEIKES